MISKNRTLTYTSVKQKEHQLISMTGLNIAEFEVLLTSFTICWQHYQKHFTFEGKPRERVALKVKKTAVFQNEADMLFFVLFDAKQNVIQQNLATLFQMEQPQVCNWLKVLRKLLKEALAKQSALPERQSERLPSTLSGEDVVWIDGVERPIERNLDDSVQEDEYSGKKKTLH